MLEGVFNDGSGWLALASKQMARQREVMVNMKETIDLMTTRTSRKSDRTAGAVSGPKRQSNQNIGDVSRPERQSDDLQAQFPDQKDKVIRLNSQQAQ